MIVRDLSAADAARLPHLIEHYPFNAYRNHRYLSRRQQRAVLYAEIERVRQSAGGMCLIAGHDDDVALVSARPLSWDSKFFGVAMGRIEHVLRGPAATRETLAAALNGMLARLRAAGVQHVACKVDVADHGVTSLLEAARFTLMDAIVTYIAHPRRPPPTPVKDVGTVRPFRAEDTAAVLQITTEAYENYRGRFQLDAHLPADRSQAFYLEWARNCCAGVMADRMLVAERADGRLIGWASVKRAEPASSAGRPISVGSLGACRVDSPGAYAALICAAAVENHAAGVLTEAMTQNSNFAMVRVLESVGAQYARAEYTFHGWLGD